MYGKSNMVIINEIMSSKSASTIVLTKSDGEHIGFMTDLVKNYRKTFWINAEYRNDYSGAREFAEQILGDSPLMNRIRQLAFCRSDFSKDIIIINTVLDYISTLNCDCLLVVDHLETLRPTFNMKIIEGVLTYCPKNLKIVLISDKFLELNYSLFMNIPPKLIGKDLLEPTPYDGVLPDEALTDRHWQLLCLTSRLGYVERRFLQLSFPGAEDLLQALSIKYRNVVMPIGSDAFSVNTRLADIIAEQKNLNVTQDEADKLLFDYCCRPNVHAYVKALDIAVRRDDADMADIAIGKFLSEMKYICDFYDYIKTHNEIKFSKATDAHRYVRYLSLVSDMLLMEKFHVVAEKAKEYLDEIEDNTPLKTQVFSCMVKSMYYAGRKKESAECTREFIREYFETYGESVLPSITGIIEKLPHMLRNSNINLIVPRYRLIEKYLLQDRFSDEYWYINILQGVVGCNLDLGNYKRSIEYLNKIKSLIPFYVVPHNLISAYFFDGDMEVAKATADEIIYASKWNGVVINLTDAYVLLGLVSIYYNKNKEAIEYLNEAIKNMTGDESAMFNAISVRTLICAETGMAENAKDVALLYARHCEIGGSKYTPAMDGTAAYCFWVLRDKENAQKYATKCIVGTTARSVYWLICTAIMINYLFEADDFKQSRMLVEKFLSASKNYGMEIIAVVCYRLFVPILEYAAANNIETEYLSLINEKIKARTGNVYSDDNLTVRYMGTTGVSLGGKELIWKTKKAKELFLLYVLRGNDGIDRNEIIEMFWGDYVYVSAINNLKTTNNLIRNTLSQCDIPFKLEYSNSKYSLKIGRLESDYSTYSELNESLVGEDDLRKRVVTVSRMLNIYGTGFANDIKVQYFVSLRDKIREELGVTLMQLIRDLVKSGEIIEAKRYISVLKKIQVNFDYMSVLSDVDKRLFK